MDSNTNKWQVNRAGLFNYWYYEDETFDFAGGKLLLRGNNGAGKSVTMQSFLPVLLDGSTRPDRLDPFGSNARRMEDYLLGEKEVSGYDERTGYLYMEFKRQHTDQYVTIGIGLKARRGAQLNFWGFVITDNRRIGKDFLLFKEETHDSEKVKIPLSKIQLRNQLDTGGYMAEKRKEYAGLVNQFVFGYETIEEYEDLIKLLIQLRSPKLSKEFRPTVIYEILEEALPPLSDEDLRHLSDTIEQMDQTKQQLEQLERENEAISSINRVYSAYNEKVLYDQAEGYKKTADLYNKEQALYDAKKERKDTLEENINDLNKSIQTLDSDIKGAEKHRQRLEKHKVWNLEEEHQEKLIACEAESSRLSLTANRLDIAREKEYKIIGAINAAELTIHQYEKEIEQLIDDLYSDAQESSFEDFHTMQAEDFSINKSDVFEFNIWNKKVKEYLIKLETISEDLRELDRLKTLYREKDSELGRADQNLNKLRNEERDWENWLIEEKSKQLDLIHKWIKDAENLTISEEKIQHMSQAFERLFVDTRYEEVKEPIQSAVSEYESLKRKEIAQLQVKIENVNENINELTVELDEWINQKAPDPNTHPLTKISRENLLKQNVSAVPLYSAVEFRDSISPDTRKRIEAALLDSGLLDALIVEGEVKLEHDRILKPNPQIMAYTLADILKTDLDVGSVVSEERVDQILRSIVIDESDDQVLSISEEGFYSIGLMRGHAVPVESVRYIGKNARKHYREEQINSIKGKIASEEKVLFEFDLELKKMNQAIDRVKKQFAVFPDDEDLATGNANLEKVRFAMEQLNEQVTYLSEQVKEIGTKVKALNHSIIKQSKNSDLKLELSVYNEAIKYMRSYERTLGDLRREHGQLLNEMKRRSEFAARGEELESEILTLKGDLNVYQSNVYSLEKEIEKIRVQIEQQGLSDVREQISEVMNAIKNLSDTLVMKRDERSSKIKDLEYIKESISELENRLHFWINLKQAWKISFEEELKRGLNHIVLSTLSLNDRADEVINQFSHISKQETSQFISRLSRIRNDQQDQLIEYSPTQRTIRCDIPDWMESINQDEYELYVKEWKNARSRDLIEMMHQGKKVSPYAVENDLKQEKERQKVYLDEQDKQLYEEILFQSVGNKLRARIGRAQKWVEEMKKLMESRKDSSGLMFSIKWKPRTAETEDELDTQDLVDLLRQNPRLLKDEDIDRVTTHFRAKIERAKALMSDSTEMQTLLQVLKQVLDYRRWFSFELSYQRNGDDRKRPLTDNQFNKFSGGEKARAMYIPLFIATYSRYREANEDAPYLISLDEAFAGVDDQNIADLFEVVEELDFNYIINSQALWGDYATVSQLAINELFRPQNADHVAVIRYIWDGHKRKLVDEDKEDSSE